MTTAKEARAVNELVDAIAKGYQPNEEELNHLRSFLPERPKPVTLEQLRVRVHYAWVNVRGNKWLAEDKDLDDFILDLRNDLNLLAEKPKPTSPALPAGMRLAEHEKYGRVVVSSKPNDIGQYKIFHLDDSYVSGADVSYVEADALTFIDAEPAKPAHPEFLETEADYESAPDGTIVACDDTPPCHKFGSEWSSVDFWGMKDDRGMSRAHRRVLRWGGK